MPRPEGIDRHRRDFLVASAIALVTAGLATGLRTAPAVAGFPRVVHDAAGHDVAISAPPRRLVVASEYTALDSLLALGTPPLAAVRRFAPDWPWSAAAGSAGVERIPDGPSGPTTDQLVAYRPDLLLLLQGGPTEVLQQCAAIAPTVQYSGDDPRACLRVIASTLDLADAAETALVPFDDRIGAARQRIRAAGRAGWTFATFIVFPDGSAGYYGMGKDATILLQDLGLRPNLRTAQTDGWASLSPETIAALDADVILGRQEDAGLDPVLSRFESSAAFRAIPAVARGRYTRLSWQESWALGESSVLSWPIAAGRIADIVLSLPS